MDWPKEKIGISDRDLEKVFKYEPKKSRAVRLERSGKEPRVTFLETDDHWKQWMETELLPPSSEDSGLVLILARRTGEQALPREQNSCKPTHDEKASLSRPVSFPAEVGGSPNAEKGLLPSPNGRRSARTLPFSLDTFKIISKNLYLHGSIARVVNRSDVPIFSRAELQMKLSDGETYSAYVYNCRSTNAWEMDLALTVTHFPHSRRTYALLFGCSINIEEEVIRRLCYSGVEASYPLLLPGIFAELERDRHIKIVEKYMDDLEEKIFELDYQPSIDLQMRGSDSESRNRDKRSQWLDTTYLKNGLVTWSVQLSKMVSHTDELRDTLFKPAKEPPEVKNSRQFASNCKPVESSPLDSAPPEICRQKVPRDSAVEFGDRRDDGEWHKLEMRRIGAKVNDRLQAIIEEYEDKIRECTMRIDGMAMATQWSHGETNVEIALATGRDSRHMRSIAIVTMVFLPGTFFASIFSMQFFNWIPDSEGNTIVSSYFWIYILVTVVATALTLGTWYYFASWREKRLRYFWDEKTPLVQ
ncbi:hypothetical protein F4818DRAFT_419474 [Hypoxylon cercidicola]|nr:hypothetical protein F4818DRAFT_419474 [Hypoxylon cercidicola]